MAESPLGALCRGGGWCYAAIWRSDRRDPRLLTIGEFHTEDDARNVVEKMLNQVHVVGEGIIGRALVSRECEWISDTSFSSVQTSDADNQDLFQGYTWWQHQFLCGIKTIAVVPISDLGVAQFGSMEKVSQSLEFLDQVKGTFCQREIIPWDLSAEEIQRNIFLYDQRFQHSSSITDGLTNIKVDPENKKLLENSASVESLWSLASSSSKYSRSSSNGFTSYESCNSMNPHIVAMPVNSKSINAVRAFNNTGNLLQHNIGSENPLQIKLRKHSDSNPASVTKAFSSLNNLPRIENETSRAPNKLGYCMQNEKPYSFQSSFASCFSVGDELKPILFDSATSFVQNDLVQEFNPTGFTSQADCAVHELPKEIPGETAAGVLHSDIRSINGSPDLLDGTIFDPFVQDWWDENALIGGNIPNFGATTANTVAEHASSYPLSVEERCLFSESVFEELLGVSGNVNTDTPSGPDVTGASDPLVGCVSGCQLPTYTLQDSLSVCKAQAPSLDFPSGSDTSEHVPDGASKLIPVSLGTLSMDDCCSLNTAHSKVSQVKKPEEVKVVKKRARPGESTRPRPKDRQQIQDRVKELREIVPNSAKCSIDALLDRTIKHMLFLQSVTKYAEKIKQAEEPKMISKDSGAVLKENSSGVVLKDNSSAASNNGGATWAYEVAGQTMVCPIIVEDLSPPGQMLVEMLCEERGFFLEIADTIRGFGLTILKGLMELRDGKIMARFLVEANKNVTRMDIFLSLVQLLQQNSLNRSPDQIAKVIRNGVPSFAEHQQSPISVPVALADR
ncbi:transcription factor bHLH157-like [Oryza brachyantha]|uniref:BHLH domain-containing protein n=1 Tax=Oryza brachyantha TaxID=4533 RepID=J3LFT0_ORYBR|nr:transcription factor bHLH157-like [Oryza brachyantha]